MALQFVELESRLAMSSMIMPPTTFEAQPLPLDRASPIVLPFIPNLIGGPFDPRIPERELVPPGPDDFIVNRLLFKSVTEASPTNDYFGPQPERLFKVYLSHDWCGTEDSLVLENRGEVVRQSELERRWFDLHGTTLVIYSQGDYQLTSRFDDQNRYIFEEGEEPVATVSPPVAWDVSLPKTVFVL